MTSPPPPSSPTAAHDPEPAPAGSANHPGDDTVESTGPAVDGIKALLRLSRGGWQGAVPAVETPVPTEFQHPARRTKTIVPTPPAPATPAAAPATSARPTPAPPAAARPTPVPAAAAGPIPVPAAAARPTPVPVTYIPEPYDGQTAATAGFAIAEPAAPAASAAPAVATPAPTEYRPAAPRTDPTRPAAPAPIPATYIPEPYDGQSATWAESAPAEHAAPAAPAVQTPVSTADHPAPLTMNPILLATRAPLPAAPSAATALVPATSVPPAYNPGPYTGQTAAAPAGPAISRHATPVIKTAASSAYPVSAPSADAFLVAVGGALPTTYVPEPYDGRTTAASRPPTSLQAALPYLGGFAIPARRRTRRGFWIAAGLIVVLAIAGLALRITRQHDKAQKVTLPAGSGVSAQAAKNPPAGAGVVYRSAAGHFAARFHKRPTEHTTKKTLARLTFTVHLAADASTNALIEGTVISAPGIPAAAVDQFLSGELAGMASAGALTVTLDTQTTTTFQGRPAREAQYHTKNGFSFTALAVVYGTQRAYLLAAPSGPTFAALKRTFVASP